MSEKPPSSRAVRVFKRILKIILWALLLSFILLLFLGNLPFQFAGLLLFGWVGYLGRVLPQITFNTEIAFDALAALGLALFGLHRMLCWWMKHREVGGTQWRLGWTAKITVMVLLLFTTSIAAVGIVHQIAWLCREPKLIVMIGRGRQTMELSAAKQLATGAKLYAMDHQDRFPQQLDELYPDYIPEYGMLFTRAMNDDPPQPFLYFPGYGQNDNPELVLITSPRPMNSAYGGSRAVIHVDISGEVIREAKYQELIQKQPAPSPGK